MIRKPIRYLHSLRALTRINFALARGSAARAARKFDATNPASWEFSGFSQNGEDGIIEALRSQIRDPNRYFVEVGASDGLENNTTWLSLVERLSGVWIEGDPSSVRRAREVFAPLNYGVDVVSMFVTQACVPQLLRRLRLMDPDVFSLDIDGNDYHIVSALLDGGLRPKICVLEYNSAFGPARAVTVPYREDFRIAKHSGDRLYYGCSVMAWKALFHRHGYRFVTVDRNGVNAVFADPSAVDAAFLESVHGADFSENFSQLREHRAGWIAQSATLSARHLVDVTPVVRDALRGDADRRQQRTVIAGRPQAP